MEKITVVGLDLAKHVFQAHGNDDKGRCVLRRRLWRGQVERFFATLEPCLVGMEACSGAHEWARRFERMGHTVKLMPASYVKPYVKQSKSDARDAEAIAEAVVRPAVPRVPVKSEEQQAELMLHRTRELLVRQRTMLSNAMRGHLAELGIVMRKGIAVLVQLVPQELEKLPDAMRLAIEMQLGQLLEADDRIVVLDNKIKERVRQNPAAFRLTAIPGVGPITASAIVATVGERAQAFSSGRGFAAWVGLTPRIGGTGGKVTLGPIGKRGDAYLRRLLIHGARAILSARRDKPGKLSEWARRIIGAKHINVATAALANKMARIAWALLARQTVYEPARHLPKSA
jgi:transposase